MRIDREQMDDIVKSQLALDYNCSMEEIKGTMNVVSLNQLKEGRRVYDSDGAFLKMICLPGKALVSCDEEFSLWAKENILGRDASWLLEYTFLRRLDLELGRYGHRIEDLHEAFLPDLNAREGNQSLSLKWFEEEEILQFKDDPRFEEAFAFDGHHPDVLGVAAYDKGEIMGMAGASRDGERLWQIGIDVMKKYRGKGIGAMLTRAMNEEVLRRGAVPFYGTAPSHIISKNVAISAGFVPAWSEIYTKTITK